jgi:lipoprotein-anchoring transpeptidase ErfK/SrfK
MLGLAALAVPVATSPAQAFLFDDGDPAERRRKREERRRKREAERKAERKRQQQARRKASPRINYKGREIVDFDSPEQPGTIIVKTRERALYQVLPDGKAKRYLVAVGKEGFAWSGVARVGMKRKNPTWTPPAEMIKRTPKYAKWKNGMPGGIPENPLGVRALYLFSNGRDTMYRIHGTNAPSSIGTAASSGCIRMLNQEVVELFNNTPVGTKVIVQ